jgi:hypothetical protein
MVEHSTSVIVFPVSMSASLIQPPDLLNYFIFSSTRSGSELLCYCSLVLGEWILVCMSWTIVYIRIVVLKSKFLQAAACHLNFS